MIRRCIRLFVWGMRKVCSPLTPPPKKQEARKSSLIHKFTPSSSTGLFTEKSPFRPLSPGECLFSEQLDELKGRFSRADESELMVIAHDLMAENRQLERFVKKANLHTWFQGVLESARREAVDRDEGVIEHDIFDEGDTIMDE